MSKRLINSFGYALNGIRLMFRSEANARIHLSVFVLVLLAAWFFELSAVEWALVLLSSALVFAAEAFNTALESLTDLVAPAPHPLAKKAKDVAAGAVLLTAIGASLVGGIIFLPKLLAYF
ncbi:MAG: diacylglycerol kinase family protein [Bacteroidota bacterium]